MFEYEASFSFPRVKTQLDLLAKVGRKGGWKERRDGGREERKEGGKEGKREGGWEGRQEGRKGSTVKHWGQAS